MLTEDSVIRHSCGGQAFHARGYRAKPALPRTGWNTCPIARMSLVENGTSNFFLAHFSNGRSGPRGGGQSTISAVNGQWKC